jgi:hypothetical protein
MPLIAKVDPQQDWQGAVNIQVHARAFGDPKINIGDTVFVWTSERSGGQGLVGRGTVRRKTIQAFPNKTGTGAHDEIVLHLDLDGAQPSRNLSILQIGPYRDHAGPPAYEELARVLYKHAHNKIVSISSVTSEFLATYFEGP